MTAPEPLALDNVVLDVPDVELAAAWYRDHAGLRAVVSTPQVAVLHPATGGAGVVLRRAGTARSRAAVWFEVADVVPLAARLGREPTRLATGLLVEIDDPWGNTVGFTDYSLRPDLGRASGV